MTRTSTRPVTIRRLSATTVDPGLAATLRDLTLPDGMMWPTFESCANPSRRDWTGQVYVAVDDTRIIGWALRFRNRSCGDVWRLHLYVHEHHRRAGVGRALVDAAARGVRSPVSGYSWDWTSGRFWDELADGEKVRVSFL